MLINWFTLFAQIVNFLILIFLLKRFLYAPIMKAMNEREKMIAEAKEQAEKAEDEARQLSDSLAKEKQALTDAKEDMLAKAKEEVREWQEKALEKARDELAGSRKAWMDGLARDKQAFIARLKQHIAHQVVQIGEKVLRDLASENLEKQVIAVFLDNLAGDDDRPKFKSVTTKVNIQSGFELNDELSRHLQMQLSKWFPQAPSFEFKVAAELGIGIRVMANHMKVEWNLGKYLEGLEREILSELSGQHTEAA